MDAPAMQAERELDALIAAKVVGARVATWSLHLIESEADLVGLEWRHGLFSPQGFPAEVLVADANGDMPSQLMLTGDGSDDGWTGIPRYSTHIAEAWKVFDHLDGHVTIHTINGGWACRINDWMRTHCWAETPALAICRSALAAVVIKEETAA